MKLVWHNVETGEFSDSWDEYPEKHPLHSSRLMESANPKGPWRLLRFECLTGQEFEFSHRMKLK